MQVIVALPILMVLLFLLPGQGKGKNIFFQIKLISK
jgi:hypothetical protein